MATVTVTLPQAVKVRDKVVIEHTNLVADQTRDDISILTSEGKPTADDDASYAPSEARREEDLTSPTRRLAYAVTPEARMDNLKQSLSRTRNLPVLRPMKKHPKGSKPHYMTPQEVEAFCQLHIDKMKEDHRTDDYVEAFMACYKSKESTVWEEVWTPFFFTCVVLDLPIFFWVQPGINKESTCIDQMEIEGRNWTIPTVHPLVDVHYQLLEKAHAELKERWDKRQEKLGDEVKYRGTKVIRLPPCPTYTEFHEIIKRVRPGLFNLWKTTKDADKEDKRGEVLQRLVDNVMDIKGKGAFQR